MDLQVVETSPVAQPGAAASKAQPDGASLDQRFRILVESIEDYAIFMLDVQGRVQTWNAGAQRIKGYHSEEIVGRSFELFYTPDDLATGLPRVLLERAARDGRAEAEGWRVRNDGTQFWANVVITALHDDAGAVTGYAKVTRDLTERRRAEEQLRHAEERFRLLVECVVDYAIFMLGPDGRVITWNVGGERIYGYQAAEIFGQHVSVLHPQDTAELQPWEMELLCAQRDGRYESEGWRVRRDGTRFWADVVVTVIRAKDGSLVGFSKVTRDLSDRIRLEQERQRAARSVEAVRARDEFLSVASHELRTPLSSLQLEIETLKRAPGDAPPDVARRLERAFRSVRRLGEMISTLLDVSRLSAGQFTVSPEALDLTALVGEVVAGLAAQSSSAGAVLEFAGGTPVRGRWDRLRLEQVTTNLVANALRHAPGSPVAVSVHRDQETAVILVEDRGPGVPQELLPRLFERFVHGGDAPRHGGLGLGLYISHRIVTAHGGTITAENRPGGGAAFTVRLPI